MPNQSSAPAVTVFGAGAWGTAMAVHIARRHPVLLYGRDKLAIAQTSERREHVSRLPGIRLPERLRLTADVDAAVDQEVGLWVLAVPMAAVTDMVQRLLAACAVRSKPMPALLWLCKGIIPDGLHLPGEMIRALLQPNEFAQASLAHAYLGPLSGPSFALEVAQGLPSALTLGSHHPDFTALVREYVHHGAVRVYDSPDLVGIELGGALKNVMAIAAGICDGLELGHNARAALITRGMAEMLRLGEALGAKPATLMGLSGLGDLLLTCTGPLSRNRQLGIALAKGQTLPEALSALGHVAEGVKTTDAALALAEQHQVDLPIVQAVYGILHQRISPRDAVHQLLSREPCAETMLK